MLWYVSLPCAASVRGGVEWLRRRRLCNSVSVFASTTITITHLRFFLLQESNPPPPPPPLSTMTFCRSSPTRRSISHAGKDTRWILRRPSFSRSLVTDTYLSSISLVPERSTRIDMASTVGVADEETKPRKDHPPETAETRAATIYR